MTDAADNSDATDRALQRIAELDRDFDDAKPGAPVDLKPRRLMLAVVQTLSDADAELLGHHLTRPTFGRVTDALRASAWLREVMAAVAGDADEQGRG